MRKTFKFFMATVTAVALMASCSSEEVTPGQEEPGGDNGKVVEGVSTYATFNFNIQDGPQSKATSVTDANEHNNVNDIRLLIFRTGTSTTCEVNAMYKSTDQGWDQNKTKTMLLSSGTKKVFVIANAEGLGADNPFSESKIVPNTTTLADFYNKVEIDLGVLTGATLTGVNISKLTNKASGIGYIMSNAIDANSEQVLVGGVSETESRTAAPGTADKNHFQINIQRAVAKGQVTYETAALPTTDKVGVIVGSSLTYLIKNINRSVNLFQKFSGDLATVGSTPWAPYYTQTESWSAADKEDITKYAPYYYSGYTTKQPIVEKTLVTNATPSIYFTENTSQVQRKGNSTYATIEATFLPLANQYVPTGGFAYNATSGFISITPAPAITQATTLYMLVDANGKNGLADGMLFTSQDDAKLAAYASLHDHTAVPAVWDGQLANIPPGFNPFESGVGALSLIKHYANGKCYYRLNFGIGDMKADMYYGVWRNYHYQANITQFGGIGENLPEKLDLNPETPLGERTHVTATITVEKWKPGASTIIL